MQRRLKANQKGKRTKRGVLFLFLSKPKTFQWVRKKKHTHTLGNKKSTVWLRASPSLSENYGTSQKGPRDRDTERGFDMSQGFAELGGTRQAETSGKEGGNGKGKGRKGIVGTV